MAGVIDPDPQFPLVGELESRLDNGGVSGIDDIRGIHTKTASMLAGQGITGNACAVLKDRLQLSLASAGE